MNPKTEQHECHLSSCELCSHVLTDHNSGTHIDENDHPAHAFPVEDAIESKCSFPYVPDDAVISRALMHQIHWD